MTWYLESKGFMAWTLKERRAVTDERDSEGGNSDMTNMNPTPGQDPRGVKTPQVEW